MRVEVSDALEAALSYCSGAAAATSMAAAAMNKPRKRRSNFDIRKGKINVAWCNVSSKRGWLLKPAWCSWPTRPLLTTSDAAGEKVTASCGTEKDFKK
jgi:hypothetical protein